DDEASGGIDVDARVFVHHFRGNDGKDNVVPNGFVKIFVRDGIAVLGGDDDAIDSSRAAIDVFDGDLRLAIGAEEIDYSGFANFGEALAQAVGELDGHGHYLFRLVAGEAEHESLIARAAGIDAHSDVAGLFLDRGDDAASVRVEAIFCARVADVANDVTGDACKIHISLRGDFTSDDDEASGDQRLAGDATHGVVFHYGIKDGVGN